MVNELRGRKGLVAVLLLVLVSAIWGSTFVVVKQAIVHMSVLDFLAWRFVLAGLLLAAARPRALVRLGRRGWRNGALLGAALAAGYMAQTYGLRSTSAAVSGFLTGLQVLFTPLIGWALSSKRPGRRTWGAVGLATAGLAVLTLRVGSLGPGEGLTIVSAVLFALQIVGLERWSTAEDAHALATVQLLTVGFVALTAAGPSDLRLPSSPALWAAVVLTAVAATAFAFVVQSWAQAHLSATSAAVVFTTEPVFAALFAAFSGEHLGWGVVVGGALVVLAMFVMGLGRMGAGMGGRTVRGMVPGAARGAAPGTAPGGRRSAPAVASAAETELEPRQLPEATAVSP